jgi:hypothetical protein
MVMTGKGQARNEAGMSFRMSLIPVEAHASIPDLPKRLKLENGKSKRGRQGNQEVAGRQRWREANPTEPIELKSFSFFNIHQFSARRTH